MSLPEAMQSNKRIRRGLHHRGWTAAQRMSAAVAADIALSIQMHQANGNMDYHAEQYTSDHAIIALVKALLAR